MQPTDSNASGSQNPELDTYRASRAQEEYRRQQNRMLFQQPRSQQVDALRAQELERQQLELERQQGMMRPALEQSRQLLELMNEEEGRVDGEGLPEGLEEMMQQQRFQEFVGDAPPDRITEPSDRFAGYYVRTPDGTWHPGENEDSVENRAAFHVRTPDGTWHPGGGLQPGGTRGPGYRLGPGENEGPDRDRGQDPDLEFVRRARLRHFQPESSLEDDRTVEQRRDAARAAYEERRAPTATTLRITSWNVERASSSCLRIAVA
jgi:hypothetical protein